MSSLTRKNTERCLTGESRRCWTAEAPHSKSPRFYTDALRASAHEDRQSTNRPSPEGAGSNIDRQGGPSQKSNVTTVVSLKGQCPGSYGLLNDSGLSGFPVSGSWSVRKSDRKVSCENCALTLAALKRQATSLSIPNTISRKESSLSAFLHDHLQALRGAPESRDVSEQMGCGVCGSHLSQLRQEVVHLILERERAKWGKQSLTKPAPGSTPTSTNPSSAPPPSSPHLSTRMNSPRSRRPARAPSTPNLEMDRWVEEQQQLAASMPMSIPSSHDGGGVPIFPHQSSEESKEGQREATSCRSSPKAPHVSRVTSTMANSTAMSFLVRAAQKLNLSSRKKTLSSSSSSVCAVPPSATCFKGLLQKSPPPVPTGLLQATNRVKDSSNTVKVKVVLRVCPSLSTDSSPASILRVDPSKRRVTVMEPANQRSTHTPTQALSIEAKILPRTYTFDSVYSQESTQAEVCEGILSDVIRCVVTGADACVLCLGDDKDGRSCTMLGSDESRDRLGVIPCAIAWLYSRLEQRREKAGAGADAGAGSGSSPAVSVSAIEVCGEDETLRDLLSTVAPGNIPTTPATDIHLYQDPIYGMQLRNHSVIHSPSAEHAASLLDAAIASRCHGARGTCGDITAFNSSHMFFTLYLGRGQAKNSSSKVLGGCTRLTLIDLASRVKRLGAADSRASPASEHGNILLTLLRGNKPVPNRDSRLTMLLQESLGNVNCRTTVVAHVSDSPTLLLQTLSTIQTTARIRRTQKKAKHSTSCSPNGRSLSRERQGSHSLLLRAFHSTSAVDMDVPLLRLHGDPDDHSSSDQSCDAIIHVDSEGSVQSSLNQTQGLSEFVPIIPSLHQGKNELVDPELATLLKELLNFSRPEGEKKKKEQEQEVTRQENLLAQGGEVGKPEGDCLKCDTFAELQERLGCIDGRETDPSKPVINEPSTNNPTESQNKLNQPGSATDKTSSSLQLGVEVSRSEIRNEVPVSEKVADVSFPGDSFQREDSGLYDCEEGSAASSSEDQPNPPGSLLPPTLCQNPRLDPCLPAQHCEVYTSVSSTIPSSLPLALEPPGSRGSYEDADWLKPEMRTSPAGKSSPMSPSLFSPNPPSSSTSSTSLATSVLLGDILPQLPTEELREMKATITVTVQQPLDLTGQDELVFTMVEEVTITGGLEKGGRGAQILRIRDAKSSAPTQGSTDSRPIRIISNVSEDLATRSSIKVVDPAVNDLAAGYNTSTQHPQYKVEKRALPSFINPMLHDVIRDDEVEFSHRKNSSGSFIEEEPLSGLQKGAAEIDQRKTFGSMASVGLAYGETVCHYNTPENKATRRSYNPDKIPSRGIQPAHSTSIPRRFGDSCDITTKNAPETRLPGYLVTMPTTLKAASLPRGWHDATLPETYAGGAGCHVTEDFGDPHEVTSASLCSPVVTLERHASPARQGLLSWAKESVPFSPGKRQNTEHRQRTSSSSFTMANCSSLDQQSVRHDYKSGTGKVKSPIEESSRLFSAKLEQIASRTNSLGGTPLEVQSLDGGSSTTSVSSKGSYEGDFCLPRASRSPRRSPRSSTSTTPAQSPKHSRSRLSAVGKLMMSSPKVRRLSTPSTKNLSFSPKVVRPSGNRSSSLSPDANTPDQTPPSSPFSTHSLSRTQPQTPPCSATRSQAHVINGCIPDLLHRGRDQASSSGLGGMDLDKITASACRSPGEERLTFHPARPSVHPVPSPYSRVTAPRRPSHLSGHASDATSVLSGELPPAMGQTSLLYNRNSVVSSGYESMVRDSEATGSSTSNRDSLSSDKSTSLLSMTARSGRTSKRRSSSGSHQRRPSHDTSLSLRRSVSGPRGRWVDRGIPEAYEIKVYEIDDVEKLQRRGAARKQGIPSFSAKLKFLEHRQQRISEVRAKYNNLKKELELAKQHLMLEPGKWHAEFDLWQTFEVDSLEHLEALEVVTARLESRVNLCKANVMMVTCFEAANKRRLKRRRRPPPEPPGFMGI